MVTWFCFLDWDFIFFHWPGVNRCNCKCYCLFPSYVCCCCAIFNSISPYLLSGWLVCWLAIQPASNLSWLVIIGIITILTTEKHRWVEVAWILHVICKQHCCPSFSPVHVMFSCDSPKLNQRWRFTSALSWQHLIGSLGPLHPSPFQKMEATHSPQQRPSQSGCSPAVVAPLPQWSQTSLRPFSVLQACITMFSEDITEPFLCASSLHNNVFKSRVQKLKVQNLIWSFFSPPSLNAGWSTNDLESVESSYKALCHNYRC